VNSRIILDSKQEAGHESPDRVWRWGAHVCTLAGIDHNPSSLLYHRKTSSSSFVPSSAFIAQLGGASQESWTGDIRDHWRKALSALLQASSLAATFWDHPTKPLSHRRKPKPTSISPSPLPSIQQFSPCSTLSESRHSLPSMPTPNHSGPPNRYLRHSSRSCHLPCCHRLLLR
jgi:hypothetical protein